MSIIGSWLDHRLHQRHTPPLALAASLAILRLQIAFKLHVHRVWLRRHFEIEIAGQK